MSDSELLNCRLGDDAVRKHAVQRPEFWITVLAEPAVWTHSAEVKAYRQEHRY